MTLWLPPSVQHRLNSLDSGPKDFEGKLLAPITPPAITPELQEGLKQSVWVLAQTTKPSRDSMPALMDLVQTLLTGHKWRTFGSEENVKMNLKVWCEAVGAFPIYAVSKAVRRSILGEAKEPSVAEFVRAVRLACGHRVLERKRALLKFVSPSGA